MEPLIRVRGLSKRFGAGCGRCLSSTGPDQESNVCPHCGAVVACNDVSFDLFRNEALGIVGESGSGKSTLVRLLHFEWEASGGSMELHRCATLPVLAELFSAEAAFSRNLWS